MRRALAAGLRALRQRPLLALVLWSVNWLISALIVLPLLAGLAEDYARRPILGAAMDGNLAALGEVAAREASLIGATVWLALALGTLYLVWSWLAAAGTVGALSSDGPGAGARFVDTGAARGWASVRLGLLAGVPYAVALVLGALLFALLRRLVVPPGLPLADTLALLALCGLPGLLLWAVVATAVDVARIRLCVGPPAPVWRLLGRALAEIPTRAFALRWLHFVAYLVLWGVLLLLQAAAVRGLGGAATAPALVYLLCQLGVVARIGLRIGATAGQLALLDGARRGVI